ncbi:MAG TPA: hypothetical protein VGM88_25990 [Kofleriaceae bacterium]|jgi:hypothetical protein
MTQLEPCPNCHRHVQINETVCPFCAASLATAFAAIPPRPAPRARIGRAAAFAFGLAATTSACGDNTIPPDAFRHIDGPPRDTHVVDAAPDAAPDAHIIPDANLDADGDGDIAIYSAAPTDNRGGGTHG